MRIDNLKKSKRKFRKHFFLILLFIYSTISFAQLPPISPPVVFTPTYTIYVSTTGNDNNTGTINNPVATFQKAIQLIPFSITSDVYGQVVYLSGDYYPTLSLVQTDSEFLSSNYKKNISIVGQGIVNIHGDNTSPNSQLIWLKGSHIKIENIHLYNSKGIGIYLSNHDTNFSLGSKIFDVLLKDITVDTTFSHGILSKFVENLSYENIEVKNGQQENTGVGGNCQWGSALRADYCKNIRVKNCTIFHNRGEGINIASSSNALVENCVSYDNFAPNLYCIRSNKVIFRKNLSYNFDSNYWRNCQSDNGGEPQAVKPSAGLAISNEVGYDIYNNTCSPTRLFENGNISNDIADNIYVYNNIFILAPINISDDSSGNCFFTELSKANNFSDLFFENNTLIGDISPSHNYKNESPLLNIILDPSYFWGCLFSTDGIGKYRFENFVWKNNIISNENIINNQTITPAFVLYGGRPCGGGSLQSKVISSNNLWHHNLSQIYDSYANNNIPNFIKGNSDQINSSVVTFCNPQSSLSSLIPSSDVTSSSHSLYLQAQISSYIQDDFFGNPRLSNSNVGAIETNAVLGLQSEYEKKYILYPNPNNGSFYIENNSLDLNNSQISIFNSFGQKIPFEKKQVNNSTSITIDANFSGLFIIKIENNETIKEFKLIKY